MSQLSELKYVVNHVFLLPKLPQKNDSNATKDAALLETCLRALVLFRDQVPERERPEWTPFVEMVSRMLELREDDGGLSTEKVGSALEKMMDGDVLALHIRGQNAGLIIRKLVEQYSFESFEVSPTSGAVMETKGRLRRCFPGPAVVINQDRIADANLRKPLAEYITRLDAETPKEVWPVVEKAKSHVKETRDTVHPRFVTDMLMGILLAIGDPLDVPRIYKNTRDDVLWKDALHPWRRSSLWLFLRVALQTSLVRSGDTSDSPMRYKSFLIFFMAHILRDALQASLPSDILFAMTAKISRRALKLNATDETTWLQYIRTTSNNAQQELSRRWHAVVEKNRDPLRVQRNWDPSRLLISQDVKLTLSTLRPYLAKAEARAASLSRHSFTSNCAPRISQCKSTFPSLGILDGMAGGEIRLFLTDLELWVHDWLNDWMSTNLSRKHSCTDLAELIDGYKANAASAYLDSPEDISIMFLTLLDLWVALDKCAIYHHPLLQDYNPGFPPPLLEPLLLPKKPQMERLFSIEQYLAKRRSRAKSNYPSIFKTPAGPKSFAVRYFEQSAAHQELRREIESKAEKERSEKESELVEKLQQYECLMQESARMTCQYIERKRGYLQHSGFCEKCQIESIARNLTIDVHEWPLPNGDLEVKSAVFELDVPPAISKWRDKTYSILVDVFSGPHPQSSRKGKIYTMHSYIGLTKFVGSPGGRLQLASTAKPFAVSHYGPSLKVSQADKDSVCVNNGLCYALYDSATDQWVADLLGHCDVREKCTIKLPPGPYEALQYAIDNTIHTSNEVIAKQEECPKALTMHEFYAFATLRAGHRLQWRNLARELAARVLNFDREETHSLVIQTTWQVGPFSELSVCRGSHADLEEEEFGISMLSVLNEALASIEGNWQGAIAMRTFVALATRLLSLALTQNVRERCFKYLRRARQVALCWTRELSQKLEKGQEEDELKVLSARTLEMALTCHGTFDVELHHLPSLLSSDKDIAEVTECSIIVHDRRPALIDDLPTSTKSLLRRHWRLAHRLEPVLQKLVQDLHNGLDSTVRRLWAEYQPGAPWISLDEPSERWLVTETSNEGGLLSSTVHFNLLDGSLLINGSPLTRLPRSYESHSTYLRLFGEKILDVVPSTMCGMAYATRSELSGYQVHFGMHDTELIIRARKSELEYELLPLHALQNDFPHAFVQGYTHWLDPRTGSIEWRPLKNAWTSSSKNWHMRSEDGGDVLVRGMSKLIDIRSPTAKAVSAVLGPLELAAHINVTFNCSTKELEVHLPRLKLGFSLKRGASQFESRQFRGMFVDTNQSFGTLIGLASKLVLQRNNGSERSVIIPHGDVRFQPDDHHVRAQIDTTSADYVPHHLYRIDCQLGRLVDNGSLKSKLFKYYLHAVTAHCLTDDLTRRTGTEEALYGLKAASTRSFLNLQPAEIDLLKLIAQLTPRRLYYPPHLRVMQEVEWASLSPLSQHNSFSKLVMSIFKQANIFHMFQDGPAKLPDTGVSDGQDLVERASIRDSTYCVHGFGAEDRTTAHDTVYPARDRHSDGLRQLKTYNIARLVDDWTTNLEVCENLLPELESWGGEICGPEPKDTILLGYDSKWLDPPAEWFPNSWSKLQSTLSQSVVETDKYRVMIFLSTLAYSKHAKEELIQTLLAFATVPGLRTLRPPKYPSFRLAHGYGPKRETLLNVVRNNARPYDECPEIHLSQLSHESWRDADRRRQREHRTAKEKRIETLVNSVIEQWPRTDIFAPAGTDCDSYISVDEAVEDAKVWFQNWHRNNQFRKHILQAQDILDSLIPKDLKPQIYSFSQPLDKYRPKRTYVDFSDLTRRPAPSLSPPRHANFDHWIDQQNVRQKDQSKLLSLLTRLASGSSGDYEQKYADDLLESYNSLCGDTVLKLKEWSTKLSLLLEAHFSRCEHHMNSLYHAICDRLRAETSITLQIVCESKMWPRLSTTELLSHLAHDKISNLRSDWKRCLVNYGLAISTFQRAERLMSCIGNETELLSELDNPGHQGWSPMDYPDWLLFEIENNILIRPAQAQIALEMITPSSGDNSIMQLNMGEGKSSVIAPIVAAALADGKMLARVVVLKPLLNQMFQLLVQRLGGILNRRVLHMPISRSLQLDMDQAKQIRSLYEKCMGNGSVLLVQPEHLLSFGLMGPERLLSGDLGVGEAIIRTQCWLDDHSRDILDESDEILSVRFELIYTMGTQHAIELSPERWVIIQHVLGLVGRFSIAVLEEFPHGLEIGPTHNGAFPRIRILQPSAGAKLLEMVAREVCDTGLPGVPVWSFPKKVRAVLFKFLTDPDISKADAKPLRRTTFCIASMKKSLLLVKGLIAGGILSFAFRCKRWRVNYGLDLSRTMLAVPYHAKDSPATRAEFSHPDTTIVLTCLSYYYGGLSDQQLYTNFETLLLRDQAQEEYERWVQDAPELPVKFRSLCGINLSDHDQCSQLVFPLLRYSKGTIDFYMSEIVFPKEMKEFPHKLSSSGWDIARAKVHPTTGFSGTNDSRYILPLSIGQRDLPQQLSTNAAVLARLLQPENSFRHANPRSDRGSLDAESLLQMVIESDPPIRVILDVGAQVLELQNEEVARTWLSRSPASQIEAAIFFDSHNDLSVISRDGITEPLMTSPFAKQMDKCLVYLDEAHTRGTDLKLPTNYRAAVTLGPDLTKDRLVQACMRMRKLGKGQSVMFCGPLEVERKILHSNGKSPGDTIDVSDVLKWSISETFIHTRRCVPLWATQGIRYQRCHIAWSKLSNSESEYFPTHAQSLLEAEAQDIETRYGFGGGRSEEQLLLQDAKDEYLIPRQEQLDAIKAKCREFNLASFGDSTFQEEQERELSPENEREQQVERPPPMTPREHSIHRDVRNFIEQGALNRSSDAFRPAFLTLAETSAAEFLDAEAWPRHLLVTRDFARTVQGSKGQLLDQFLRPVHWIASRRGGGSVDWVVLSPYEVQQLLPSVRRRRAVTIHVYSPRVSASARTLEGLAFCAVPPVPRSLSVPPITMQLNLFAGQLYLQSFEDYLSLCRFLGLCSRAPDSNVEVACDGFVSPANRGTFDPAMERECPFATSPVEFLKTLMALRRKGQGFAKTHLGEILNGELVRRDKFQG